MKKLFLLLCILMGCNSLFAQTLSGPSTEIYNNDEVIITASGETRSKFINIPDRLPQLTKIEAITPGAGYTMYVNANNIAGVQAFNTSNLEPTKFKMRVYNSSNTAIKAKFTFLVTFTNVVNPSSTFNNEITLELTIKSGSKPTTPTVVYNTEQYVWLRKENCTTPGTIGSLVKYTVPAKKYSATTLQLANQKALDDINANAQNYANANGTCEAGYFNEQQSRMFTPNCGVDYQYNGADVQYTVPAKKYIGTTLQEANQQAINDINQNGQNWANNNKTGECLKIYYNEEYSSPFWKSDCGVGYIGNAVVYTIPARKYSTTTPPTRGSQFTTILSNDARENGPIYANTNGSCEVLPTKIYISLSNLRGYGVGFYKDAAKTQMIYVTNFKFNYTIKEQGKPDVTKQVTVTGSRYDLGFAGAGASIVLAPGTGYEF